jgi:hypothetical protein
VFHGERSGAIGAASFGDTSHNLTGKSQSCCTSHPEAVYGRPWLSRMRKRENEIGIQVSSVLLELQILMTEQLKKES